MQKARKPLWVGEKLSFEMTSVIWFHLYFKRINFTPSTVGNEDADSGQIHGPEKLQIKMPLIDPLPAVLIIVIKIQILRKGARRDAFGLLTNPRPNSEAQPALFLIFFQAKVPISPRGARSVSRELFDIPHPPNPHPPRPRKRVWAVKTRGGVLSPSNSLDD